VSEKAGSKTRPFLFSKAPSLLGINLLERCFRHFPRIQQVKSGHKKSEAGCSPLVLKFPAPSSSCIRAPLVPARRTMILAWHYSVFPPFVPSAEICEICGKEFPFFFRLALFEFVSTTIREANILFGASILWRAWEANFGFRISAPPACPPYPKRGFDSFHQLH
jgi:hypothetical protein